MRVTRTTFTAASNAPFMGLTVKKYTREPSGRVATYDGGTVPLLGQTVSYVTGILNHRN